jgi:hypothetical protein
VKKGFPPDQCIDGCEHCRRARVRCEGGKPCLRCREMQMECVEETSISPSRQDPSSMSTTRSARTNASERARLACQNCRRDNKKAGCRLADSALFADQCWLLCSVMIRGHVPGVLLDRRSVFMWDVVPNSSSCDARLVDEITRSVKTQGLANTAPRMGRNA